MTKLPATARLAASMSLLSPPSQPENCEGPDHLAFIDALRGWAFLSVLFVHARIGWSLPTIVERLGNSANYGVQLFFVVSAFTLFRSLDARKSADRRPVPAFLARRLFRIAPMFWLALVGYVLLDGMGPREAAPSGLKIQHLLATALFVHGWHPETINSAVPGGWSIAVEMNFYLLLPVFFALLTDTRKSLIAFAALVPLSVIVSVATKGWLMHAWSGNGPLVGDFTYYWLPRQLPVFFLGFILFHVLKHRPLVIWARVPPLAACALVLAVSLTGSLLPLTYLCASVAFLVLALSLARAPAPLLVNRLTCAFGKVSYSAYLVHFAVLAGLRHLSAPPLATGRLSQSAAFAVFYVVSATGTFAVASATYHLIEVPGQQLGRQCIAVLGWSRSARVRAGSAAEREPRGSLEG